MKTNLKYSPEDVKRIRALDIRQFIPGCSMKKKTQEVECPFCGKKKFNVSVKDGHNSARCWVCENYFSDAVAAVAHYSGINLSTDWLRALEETARQGGAILEPVADADSVFSPKQLSFLRQQLSASGLDESDVLASVIDEGQPTTLSPFRKGRVDQDFVPDERGDDMLIYYYDLEGRLMTYTRKGSAKPRPYIRVRWANPAIHGDNKYMTPKGASCRVFIPEAVRLKYKNRTHIETLFLQEGEKKAEKACKHGMLSLGIQGINNFGSQQEGLLQDIQDVARACSISNIVLVMDSDWNNLHRNIVLGDAVDKRPKAFASAVIKYRQFMKTFHNIGLSVNVWWGHVNENDHGDKGVDDLLCGSLLGREHELIEDVERTMNSHNGQGRWLNIHKITEESDTKIKDFWTLNNVQEFYNLHKDRLKDVDTFKIGLLRYKVEDDRLVPVSRFSSSSDIFSVYETDKGEKKIEFEDQETLNFLVANGFYRLRKGEKLLSSFDFIRIDDGIVHFVPTYYIRDFVRDYVVTNNKDKTVQKFFIRKIQSLLSDKQLENLPIIHDDFNNFLPGVQRTYYNNGQVEITSSSITPNKQISNVWADRIIPRNFRRVPIIRSITKDESGFHLDFEPEARDCEFLTFILNTSNMFFPHNAPRALTADEEAEYAQHIVNKITTIGYLLADYKYATEYKAVVIQDHRMSEVGQSQGGTGKSMIGNAIAKLVPQAFIDGKQVRKDDEFLLSGVKEYHRNIFIDDVKTNFPFEMLFTWITADLVVNPKGEARFNIPVAVSPKFLITTNHTINKSQEDATFRRISYMESSSWYNPKHTLADDFGHLFFFDWDDEQWNLFDNFMAECVMYYLLSYEQGWAGSLQGAVPPPMRNIEKRSLRQAMSEVFFQWAEEFFDPTGVNLGQRLVRKNLFLDFSEYAGGGSSHGVTRSNIKEKVIAYCKFKGWHFNITRPHADDAICFSDWARSHPGETFIGDNDKSGGVEYFRVTHPDKADLPF